MLIARVIGTTVSTVKDEKLTGRKLLIMRQTDETGNPTGKPYVAVDTVDAGVGDLVLTCTGALSRNRSVGERLGRGEPLAEVLSGREVAEGVPTTRAAAELARRHGAAMPVIDAVESMLDGRLTPRAAVYSLMTRELKREAVL